MNKMMQVNSYAETMLLYMLKPKFPTQLKCLSQESSGMVNMFNLTIPKRIAGGALQPIAYA